MARTKTQVAGQPASGANNRTLAIVGIGAVALVLIIVLALVGRGLLGSSSVTSGEGEEVASLDAQGMTVGSEDAAILIREFADFRCPHCKDAAASLTPEIIENYVNTGLVRLQFTPVAVINDESTFGAQASMCADNQGKFWTYHDELFERQGRDLFSIQNLTAWAGDLGLDEQAFRNCLVSGEYLDELNANMRDFQASGGTGTPTFMVNGQLINGAIAWDEMKGVIDTQLESAGAAPATE
jgi:protein-disulfide isomerase